MLFRSGLPFRDVDWTVWGDLLDRVHHPRSEVTIALVGKYIGLPDAYLDAGALFVALRDALRRLSLPPLRRAAVLAAIPLLLLSAGWTLRAVTLVSTLRATAFVNRSDWAVA